MRALILAALLTLPSCAAIEAVKQTATKANELLADAKETYEVIKTEFSKAKQAADTNKDGKTTAGEWWQWLLLTLGIGGPAAGAVAEGRRRIAVRNAESDARKSRAEDRLDRVEKALETHVRIVKSP